MNYRAYGKQNIGRLLYEKKESNHSVRCMPVRLGKHGEYCIIIFVDDTAKYISSYSAHFILLTHCEGFLKDDTPDHIEKLLLSENKRLYLNADVETCETCEPHLVLKDLMPYNQIMYYMPLVMKWGDA